MGLKYWIDGYISRYNICIEWDEKGHKYRKEYDKLRENYLKENSNCVFIRINQDEFLKDINLGLLNVSNQIKLLLK